MKKTIKYLSKFLLVFFLFFLFSSNIFAKDDLNYIAKTPQQDFFKEYSTEIKTQDKKINEYLDKNGNIDYSKLNFFQNSLLSSNPETAKKEIRQMYILGLFPSSNTFLGDVLDIGSFFQLLFFLIFGFISNLLNFISLIFPTILCLLLVKIQFSDILEKFGVFIQDLVLNKFVFFGGNIPIITIFIAFAFFIGVFFCLLKNSKMPLKIILKNLLSGVVLVLCVGIFISNTQHIHKTIERVVVSSLDTVIPVSKVSSEIGEKSLIFKLFQEQSFLLRHFGVRDIKNIKTAGNDKETPIEQYERLILSDDEKAKELSGEATYAIHQGRPRSENDKTCDNPNIKHRTRSGTELMITLISIFSLISSFAFGVPVFFLLIFLVVLSFLVYLRPIIAVFACIKSLFTLDFRKFFTVIFQSGSWFIFVPLMTLVCRFFLVLIFEISNFLNEINPEITIIFNLLLFFASTYFIKNIKVTIEYIKETISNLSKFTISGLDPNKNFLQSANTFVVEPTVRSLKLTTDNFKKSLFSDMEEGVKNIKEQGKKLLNGDDIVVENNEEISEQFFNEDNYGLQKKDIKKDDNSKQINEDISIEEKKEKSNNIKKREQDKSIGENIKKESIELNNEDRKEQKQENKQNIEDNTEYTYGDINIIDDETVENFYNKKTIYENSKEEEIVVPDKKNKENEKYEHNKEEAKDTNTQQKNKEEKNENLNKRDFENEKIINF